jgi:hypothetical protein
MNSNSQSQSGFGGIKLLIPIALVVIAALGCSFSSEPDTPAIPDFPDIPELPLSEASDRARIERTLPWTVVEETCSEINGRVPITEFATVAGTSQHEATENLEVNEYMGEIWKSSRLLMESSPTSNTPRSLYSTITYLDDEGFASWRLEELQSIGYETIQAGSALIVLSNPDDDPPQDDRSADQVYVFDDRVYSNIVVVYGNDIEPFCTRDELYVLAEQLIAGSK